MAQDKRNKVPLIEVENMKKYYPIKGGIITHTTGYVKAVDGVSFSVMVGNPAAGSLLSEGRSWGWRIRPKGRYIMTVRIWPPVSPGK